MRHISRPERRLEDCKKLDFKHVWDDGTLVHPSFCNNIRFNYSHTYTVSTLAGPVRVGAHMGPYGSSWTGLGRSGHARFPTFGLIPYVSGPKMGF